MLKCPITERIFCSDIIYVQLSCFVWIGDTFYNLTTHQKWKAKTTTKEREGEKRKPNDTKETTAVTWREHGTVLHSQSPKDEPLDSYCTSTFSSVSSVQFCSHSPKDKQRGTSTTLSRRTEITAWKFCLFVFGICTRSLFDSHGLIHCVLAFVSYQHFLSFVLNQ